jgi:uncharacterized membrane protein
MYERMPFCSQCGYTVGDADRFCYRCGANQPAGASAPPPLRPPVAGHDPLAGIQPRTAALLCYVPWIGWIAAVIVLASDRFRRDRGVRFHAFQGLYLSVAWLLDQYALRYLPWPFHVGLNGLIALALLGASIFMIIKVLHDQTYSLPLFGELAARSVAED